MSRQKIFQPTEHWPKASMGCKKELDLWAKKKRGCKVRECGNLIQAVKIVESLGERRDRTSHAMSLCFCFSEQHNLNANTGNWSRILSGKKTHPQHCNKTKLPTRTAKRCCISGLTMQEIKKQNHCWSLLSVSGITFLSVCLQGIAVQGVACCQFVRPFARLMFSSSHEWSWVQIGTVVPVSVFHSARTVFPWTVWVGVDGVHCLASAVHG